MNPRTIVFALIAFVLTTSCKEKADVDMVASGYQQLVSININGIDVYRNMHLQHPDDLVRIFSNLCAEHLDRNDSGQSTILLKYSLKQADLSLIDSYSCIYLDKNRWNPTCDLAIADDPDENPLIDIRPSYKVAMEDVYEHCEKLFKEWWREKNAKAQQDKPR